jgi:hypothetical protein
VFVTAAADPLFSWTFHRSITHALAFIPVGALLAMLPFLIAPSLRERWQAVYAASFLGYATHALATIYVNSDGIMNDDAYDYDTIGLPFFYKLGQFFYQYEVGRKKKHLPDLSKFKIAYEKQENDGRPAIKEADN